MKRLLANAAVLAASLAFAGATQAGGPGKGQSGNSGHGNGPSHSSSDSGKGSSKNSNHSNSGKSWLSHGNFGSKPYLQTFGKSFSHGTFYPGKSHNHWTYQCYSSKYGCNCYWCPYTTCYYYWCEPKCCYYPISYVASAPPVQVPTQTQVQVQTQTQIQTQGPASLGGPPAGIPALPK